MPAQIERLPRDHRGFPVPYVAQRWPLVTPPPIDAMLGMTATADTSKPEEIDLGHMDEYRQRRCWFHSVCQVCERSIKPGSRWLAGGVGDRPLEDLTFREPYVCGSCLRYAVQVCPGLVRGRRDGALRVVKPRTVEMFVERLVLHDPVARTTTNKAFRLADRMWPPYSIAFYLLGVVTDGEVMLPEEFLRK